MRHWRLAAGLGAHFPLTTQGSLTLIISAGALRLFGYASMDLVVFALCLCALIVVIISLFTTVIAGYFVQRSVLSNLAAQVSTQRGDYEAGYRNESGFSLPALAWLPLVRLRWTITQPINTETFLETARDKRLHEFFLPTSRGEGDTIRRRFEVSDALGLCRYCWHGEQIATYRILPSLGKIRPITLQRAKISDDGLPNATGAPEGDRMEIRPYSPGDSLRDILWKGFARNRQLNVRLPEKSVAFDDKTHAYLLSGTGDEPAAALARIALENRLLGKDWCFGADGSPATNSLDAALDAIAKSAGWELPQSDLVGEPTSARRFSFENFIRQQNLLHCVVFAGVVDENTLDSLIQILQTHPVKLSLLLGIDFEEPSEATSFWRQRLHHTATQRIPGSSLPLDRLTTLRQRVESLVIIDRRSGQAIEANRLGGEAFG